MDENVYYPNPSSASEMHDLASDPHLQHSHPAIRVPRILRAPKRLLRMLTSLGGLRRSSCRPDPGGGDDGDDQIVHDLTVALDLQLRLFEENLERKLMARRRERRMWYEYYLRPFSMIVSRSDLIHRNGNDDDASFTTRDEIDEDKIIEDRSPNNKKHSTIDSLLRDDQAVCLRLPTEGRRSRIVDGTCAFCLDDYCEGETVVWSSCPGCKHVFHKECFLQWASKGKKRCPICRHWFVPGQRIETQKIVHGEAWTDALAEMERAENKEKFEKQ